MDHPERDSLGVEEDAQAVPVFEFRVDGKSNNLYGDGMAVWLTKARAGMGPAFGRLTRPVLRQPDMLVGVDDGRTAKVEPAVLEIGIDVGAPTLFAAAKKSPPPPPKGAATNSKGEPVSLRGNTRRESDPIGDEEPSDGVSECTSCGRVAG
jgi:hypothetical protein